MVYLQVENHSEVIDDSASSFTSPSYPQPYSINLSTLAAIFGRIYPRINILFYLKDPLGFPLMAGTLFVAGFPSSAVIAFSWFSPILALALPS